MRTITFPQFHAQQDTKQSLTFSLAGVGCRLTTNSDALAEHFATQIEACTSVRCELEVNVQPADASPLQSPHFRGMHHLVVAIFGSANVFLFDLQRRKMSAHISAVVGENATFWRDTLLPIAAGLLGTSIGVLPVHSACLTLGNLGFLIAGESGAGKSTLAMALALDGCDYVSDDWTFCSTSADTLKAYGVGSRLKLLPDASRHFSPLLHFQPSRSLNDELAFEIVPENHFPIRRRTHCTPQIIIFYLRHPGKTRLTRLPPNAAKTYVESGLERLPEQLPFAMAERTRLTAAISKLPCWEFACSGSPQVAAAELSYFLTTNRLRD